jgi:hypothetical protein
MITKKKYTMADIGLILPLSHFNLSNVKIKKPIIYRDIMQ